MRKSKQAGKQRFTEVQILNSRIKTETPETNDYLYDYKVEQAIQQQELQADPNFHKKYKINFSDLPISHQTKKGLTNRQFLKMTEVQRCVIPHALGDRDVMAASRTGSGKTLAYLVPIVEKLYRHRFIPLDGLGALVIVPVRELAIQVFEVLNSFSSEIELSVGLIIGGKDLKSEKQAIRNMNILICTPGRLLQHMEETYGFQTHNLQLLVLDEADVMLQMGFQNTLNAIMKNLPQCQTMLFSATLSNQIHSLASMSMNNPERIFLNAIQAANESSFSTPHNLTQYYMETEPHEKINTIFSFLKTHKKQKVIIFFSTCKQVRYMYEALKKFRLGTPLFELQGHQKQKKRMAIYFTFTEKKFGILLCTNIAARGLDFPAVDFVIQADTAENIETYIHRVGRTARFRSEGKGLALVSKGEQAFIHQLKEKGIEIKKIKQNPEKYFNIQSSLESICSEHQEIKYLAQRAIISYLKFIYKAPDKSVFNINSIDSEKLAASYGLKNAPSISIKNQNEPKQEDHQNEVKYQENKPSKIQKMRLKAAMKKAQKKQGQIKEQEPQEEDFLKVKKTHRADSSTKPILSVSKNQLKKVKPYGHFDGKNKTHFDDDLNPIPDAEYWKSKYQHPKIVLDRTVDLEQKLQQHENADNQAQKARRKEKRQKKQKQRQRIQQKIQQQQYQLDISEEQDD